MKLKDIVQEADPNYFTEMPSKLTKLEAGYRLATYLFDSVDIQECRQKLKKILPKYLYLLALEQYIDGNHDT